MDGEENEHSDHHVGRVVGYAAAIFIFRQAHVALLAPTVAPPVFHDPLGRGVSDDQYGVVHRVRVARTVVVDALTENPSIRLLESYIVSVEIIICGAFKRDRYFRIGLGNISQNR